MKQPMNSKLFVIAVAIVAAFGIAVAVVGPVTLATPAVAQNMTGGGNMTAMGGNMTGGNMTGGNWTLTP
jgi:ABC-type enterobactin transport system permease subunit